MAYNWKDNFLRLPEPKSPKQQSPELPESYRNFPPPNSTNPFGDLPKIAPQRDRILIWPDLHPNPIAPIIPYPLPSPGPVNPFPDPFPDPSKTRLPPPPETPQPSPYDLNPSHFPGQGESEPGGVLGRLLALYNELTPNIATPEATAVAMTDEAPEPESSEDSQTPVRILSRRLAR